MAAGTSGDLKSDEEIARQLQLEFEQEEREERERIERDEVVAKSIAAGTHTLSDSSGEDDVIVPDTPPRRSAATSFGKDRNATKRTDPNDEDSDVTIEPDADDSDVTIDPDSPRWRNLASDGADSDSVVEVSTGARQNVNQNNKSSAKKQAEKVKDKMPLERRDTRSIEELFGPESDGDKGVTPRRAYSTHQVSDSDSDGEARPTSATGLSRRTETPTSATKRRHQAEDEPRTRCPYGRRCYRKNPSHFREMAHPADHPNATPDDKRSSPGNSVKRQKTTERAKRTDSRSSHQSPRPQGGSPAQGAAATRGCQGNSVTKTPSGQTPKRAPGSSQKTRAGSSLRHSPSATAGRTVSSDVQPGTCGESSSGRATSAAASKNSASEAVIHCAIRKSPDEALTDSEPIRFLLTKVTGIDAEFNNCLAMDIKEILSPQMGNLKKSAQFNYKIDIPWLVQQYPPEFRSLPLLVVHGAQREEKREIESEVVAFDHIRLCQAPLDIMFGTHHTKMMLLLYDSGLRVVIHTANLVAHDWFQKTQGMWVSPVFPRLPEESATSGDSETRFKRDLLEYLSAYRAAHLKDWLKFIRQHDLSAAKVYLIGSVPGRHTGEKKCSFGHLKLRKVLEQHGPDPKVVRDWSLIGQFSSVGSLGGAADAWLTSEWLSSLQATRRAGPMSVAHRAKLSLIFPTKENVRQSLEGYAAGGSIPYSINTAKKQTYLHTFFHQWRSERRGRSHAMPHIKTYTRVSPDHTHLAWVLLTSANLSKAAWGALEKGGAQLMVRSYELGVLFLPQNYDADQETFEVMKSRADDSTDASASRFPLPFDLPLTIYFKQDKPWIWDIPYVDKPDTHGTKWCPPLR